MTERQLLSVADSFHFFDRFSPWRQPRQNQHPQPGHEANCSGSLRAATAAWFRELSKLPPHLRQECVERLSKAQEANLGGGAG